MATIIISSQEEVKKYYDDENSVNQSSLKSLLKGFNSFMKEKNNPEQTKKDYFVIGSAVDTLLTGTKEAFLADFYVSQLENLPSDTEMKITEIVFERKKNLFGMVPEGDLDDCREFIQDVVDDLEWQKNWKNETRVNKIITKCNDFYLELKNSYGKTVLSRETYQNILEIVKSLETNERTKKYFNKNIVKEQDDSLEYYYQLPLYFKYNDVDCKALLDLCIIKRKNNGEIDWIQPIDLKTMSGETLRFLNNLKSYRYDIQSAFYKEGLIKHFEIKEEQILPFKFIVESSTEPGTPLVYKLTDFTLAVGKYGYEKEEYKIKGFEDLLEEYKIYEKQGWKQDIILDKNPTEINLDWDKGILDE